VYTLRTPGASPTLLHINNIAKYSDILKPQVSETIMQFLWFCNIVALIYIDDIITICYEDREEVTAFFIDALCAVLGMEFSSKEAARQSTRVKTAKILGLNYDPYQNGFIRSIPKTKIKKSTKQLADIRESCNLVANPGWAHSTNVDYLTHNDMEKMLGLLGHIQEATPVATGRAIVRPLYWWCNEDNFKHACGDRGMMRRLYAECNIAEEIVRLGTPKVMSNMTTCLPNLLMRCDAAGAEDNEPCIASITFGLPGGKPVIMQKRIMLANTDLDGSDDSDVALWNSIKDSIAFWEFVSVMETFAELGDEANNHFVKLLVDNTTELFGLVTPSSASEPVHRHMAVSWQMNNAVRNISAYVAYVASPRNLADIWTRATKMTDDIVSLNGLSRWIGVGNKIRIKSFLKMSNQDVIKKLFDMDRDYRKLYNI